MLTQNDIEYQLTQRRLDVNSLVKDINILQTQITTLKKQLNDIIVQPITVSGTITPSRTGGSNIIDTITTFLTTVLFKGIITFTSNIIQNLNTSAAPSSTVPFQQAAVDSGSGGMQFDTFDNNSTITFQRANGTNASKTHISINDLIGIIRAQGYAITQYITSRASMRFIASEDWTDSTAGTHIIFFVSNPGSLSQAQIMQLFASGGIGIGAAPSDPGLDNLSIVGTANAVGGYKSGSAVGESTVITYLTGTPAAGQSTKTVTFTNGIETGHT